MSGKPGHFYLNENDQSTFMYLYKPVAQIFQPFMGIPARHLNRGPSVIFNPIKSSHHNMPVNISLQ